MKAIWKYPLPAKPRVRILIPRGAVGLTVQVQDGEPKLWAMVDLEQEPVDHYFRIFATGQTFDDDGLKYIGTFQMQKAGEVWDDPLSGHAPVEVGAQTLVFHVFEEI